MPDRYSAGQPLPSALGYFVAWHGGHWVRLDSLLLQPKVLRSSPPASEWISVERTLRFVIARQMSGQPMRDQPLTPSALGYYFFVERNGKWLRLVPDPQGALYRGPLRQPSTSGGLSINRKLRFVIEQQTPESYVGSGQSPSVLGYFISKPGGRWLRLDSIA